MADLLLTVYDDDQTSVVFDCEICDRSLRGETQYKIHLTTLQHLKKEEVQAAKGLIPKPTPLPEWTDIKQYLEYLNLDEPIIGLSALVQEEDIVMDDGKVQLKYRCKICALQLEMSTMVAHVVSRKHRQKYLLLKRPDLVTWPQMSKGGQKQPGLVMRAKAALVEKQEGWGTPAPLNRTKVAQKLKKKKEGYTMKNEESSYSHTHENSYLGQDRRVQLPVAEDGYRQSYLEDDVPARTSRFHEDDLYDRSSTDKAAYRLSYPKGDRSEMPYYQDSRQRSFQDDHHTERPYFKEAISARSFLEDSVSGRPDIDRTVPARSYNNERQEEYYPETNRRAGWSSGQDIQDDSSYRGSVAGSRFADSEVTGSARRLEDTDLRVGKGFQGRMYTSHERKGHDLHEVQRPRRQFQSEEDAQSLERSGSFGVTIPRHRDGLGEYAQEHSPVKRKRKSRFSDATPLEIALTQKSLLEDALPKKNPRRGEPTTSQASNRWMDQHMDMQEERHPDHHGFRETTRYDRGPGNFQEPRAFVNDPTSLQENQRFEQHSRDFDKRYFEGHEHLQDMKGYEKATAQKSTRYESLPRAFQESRHFDDRTDFQQSRGFKASFEDNSSSFQQTQGFKESYTESAGYEKLPRDFQESRYVQDEHTDFQQSRGFQDNPKDFQQGGHFEDFRQTQGFKDSYNESVNYENLSRIVRESRRFQDDRTDFQQARRFKDNPRDSQHGGHLEDDPASFRETRGFEDNPRGFQRGGHFDDASGFQQARGFIESPRAGHFDEEPRGFQNLKHTRGTETARGNERKEGGEGRYGEGDFRQGLSSRDGQREFEWGRGSAEQPQDLSDYYTDDADGRVYQANLWHSKPPREEETAYGENQAQRPRYQRDYNCGAEVYDPFHPLSSPPKDVASKSSLEKLAATLLELVGHKSN